MNVDYIAKKNELVSKSPFAKYTDEERVYDGRPTPISLEHIMYKVKRGNVEEFDFLLLEIVGKLGFATSRMVLEYLVFMGYENISQVKVSARLKFLNKINILGRYKFITNGRAVSFRCYFLEKAGGYLLASRDVRVPWRQSDAGASIEMIKRNLSRNQVLLSYLLKSKNAVGYEFRSPVRLMQSRRIYKVPLRLDFKNGHDDHIAFFEIVRNYSRDMDNMIEKLKAYKEYYEFFTIDREFKRPPQLVFVGEDDYHLLEMYKKILLSEIELKDMEILFSTDLRVFEGNPEDTLLSIEIVDAEGVIKPRITKYSDVWLK